MGNLLSGKARPALAACWLLGALGCAAPAAGSSPRAAESGGMRDQLAAAAEPSLPALEAGRVLEGESVSLVPGLEPGQRFAFDKREASFTSSEFGRFVNRTTLKGVATVVAAEGGIATKIAVRCDPDCLKGASTTGDLRETATVSSYAGKELTVRVDRLGSIVVDLPAVDPHDRTSLEDEAQALLAPPVHMPADAHPVKAGDEWTGAAPGVTSHCRLRAVRAVQGRKVAEIEVREARAGREYASVVLADVATGLVLASTMSFDASETEMNRPVHTVIERRDRVRLLEATK